MTSNEAARRRGIRAQQWLLRFSRNWLKIVLLVLGLYVGLPFAAPTLMHLGATGPANLLYTIYSPMCHQFAFRSWFLFGEQSSYPREDAGVEGLHPFEDYARADPYFARIPDLDAWTDELIVLAKNFIGNEQMGYKVALCERDIGIYGALWIGGALFALVRHRLRPIPLWLYVIIGIIPIGLDGFSQLLGYPPFGVWAVRESTPLLRTVTGSLFGLANAWLAFPYMEQAMRETRTELEEKLRRVMARDGRAAESAEVEAAASD